MHGLAWWFLHAAGMDDLSGPWYGFWSGLGSDLGEFAAAAVFAAGAWLNYRHHNCHVRGCWRVGRHPVEGTTWTVCHRHHPDGAPSHADVIEAHEAAKEEPDAPER